MMALNKIKGDQNVKKEQQENMQEQAILNKLQGTLTLPKITEWVYCVNNQSNIENCDRG